MSSDTTRYTVPNILRNDSYFSNTNVLSSEQIDKKAKEIVEKDQESKDRIYISELPKEVQVEFQSIINNNGDKSEMAKTVSYMEKDQALRLMFASREGTSWQLKNALMHAINKKEKNVEQASPEAKIEETASFIRSISEAA